MPKVPLRLQSSHSVPKREKKKKVMAINYIVEHLPVNQFLKGFVAFVLSGFIDNAVEYAVKYMNSLKANGEQNEY